jgi:hypothetical protein
MDLLQENEHLQEELQKLAAKVNTYKSKYRQITELFFLSF